MSSSDHAILDLGEDELQFTNTDYKSGGESRSSTLGEFPASPGLVGDTEQLVGEEAGPSQWRTGSFWTLAFYQQFFDVDTTDVKNRVLYSMVPVPGRSFLQHHIRPRPDLYGPFWVCVTLVFSIAISGNFADFLQKSVDPEQEVKWHYDFHKVSLAAMVVFSYASLLPAGLYGFLWWAGTAGTTTVISFLELVCLYGYSLTIYIPVSLLWLVQVSWWQWLCVLAGAGLSGYVLFLPIYPAVRHQTARAALIVMAVIVTLHLLLAVGFMLYFFHVPAVAAGGNIKPVNSTVIVPEQRVEPGVLADSQTGGENKQEVKNSEVSEIIQDDGKAGDGPGPNDDQTDKKDLTGPQISKLDKEETKKGDSIEGKEALSGKES